MSARNALILVFALLVSPSLCAFGIEDAAQGIARRAARMAATRAAKDAMRSAPDGDEARQRKKAKAGKKSQDQRQETDDYAKDAPTEEIR